MTRRPKHPQPPTAGRAVLIPGTNKAARHPWAARLRQSREGGPRGGEQR